MQVAISTDTAVGECSLGWQEATTRATRAINKK